MKRQKTIALAFLLERIRLLRASLQYCRQYELDYSTDFIDLCFEYLAEIEAAIKSKDYDKALQLISEFMAEFGESSHTVLFKGILKSLKSDITALKSSGNVTTPEPVKPVAQNLSALKYRFSRVCASFSVLFDDTENGQAVNQSVLQDLANDARELFLKADESWNQIGQIHKPSGIKKAS